MLTLLGDNLWSQIQKRSKRPGNRLAAVAYVSSDDVIRFGAGDTLVVDGSDAAIRTGQTAARVLRSAHNRGARVVTLPGLHAKVLVLGGSAIVGSANLSLNSRKLFEAGVLSSEPQLVAAAIQLIVALAANGTTVTEEFLDRIEGIPVTKRVFGGKRRPGAPIRLRRNRAWILGIAEDPKYPGSVDAIEAVSKGVVERQPAGGEPDWFWWSGKNRFTRLAAEGDHFISLYRPRKSIVATRTVTVYPPTAIRQVFQEKGLKAKTFHSVEHDADARSLTFGRFVALAKKVGIDRLSVNSCREITSDQLTALQALWPQ